MFPVSLRSIKEKHKNVSFLRFVGFSKNLSKLFSGTVVLDNALHAIRSLLCVATNVTPHERFFSYQRRSSTGDSLPSWLTTSRKAYVKRFVRLSKNDPLVD